MGSTTAARTWDEASSPGSAALARRFEAAWRDRPGRRPDPEDFLPDDPDRRPAALLALLRAEMGLRREAGERVDVESYRSRYPELSIEALVALIYEEFCLREEAGESPEPDEYYGRFPGLVAPLRRVLEIHDLIGSCDSTPLHVADLTDVPFPEVGQTIAGFRLVEELGRGSFSRVFLAEERQLADRPVALKVTRAGSREPQTLARLQHTHIVPVYSYRIDPAAGLYLLCMPYLGRTTLADVLKDPEARGAVSGAELVAALDRLEPAAATAEPRAFGRRALASRSFDRAIAWWGARLAEALQHAHERGVLHRDIKPSNVLIAADGTPMLLDFNLAHDPRLDDPDGAPAALGGTLAYMAPEHLDALADGHGERIDARCDLYALGVVLFEALATSRPFSNPAGGISMADVLRRAAEERRAGAPGLRDLHPEVPPALEAVVRKCLAPDPSRRYATASELAMDLQAVADDGPLRFAREPQPSRSLRWARRHCLSLSLTATAAFLLGVAFDRGRDSRADRAGVAAEVRRFLDAGDRALAGGHLDLAIADFDAADRLAARVSGLDDLDGRAVRLGHLAGQSLARRRAADALVRDADVLRRRLLGPVDATTLDELERALQPFFVLENPDWARSPELFLLDPARRDRLVREVDDLLFLGVVMMERARPGDPEAAREGLGFCDRAAAVDGTSPAWQALRVRCGRRLGGLRPEPAAGPGPGATETARACVRWTLIRDLEGRPDAALALLDRAVGLDPDDPWVRTLLAEALDRAGRPDRARHHAEVAAALRPSSAAARALRDRLTSAPAEGH
ncbi:MAG TPA: protein kinase [Isosphaeraceae bacterium]|nr:protein kinase [Isosphaeraceae bacterium]